MQEDNVLSLDFESFLNRRNSVIHAHFYVLEQA